MREPLRDTPMTSPRRFSSPWYYKRLRKKYTPERIKLAIIAESPPASGKYFYDDKGKVSEPLFKALMKHIGFKSSPSTKADGLRRFQKRGWILVDATYEPVNNKRSNRQKAKVIQRDYVRLRRDLEKLGSPPLILIKKNVCQILAPNSWKHKLT